MERIYAGPASHPRIKGELEGTYFHRIFLTFTANTRLHGKFIPPDSLGVIKFRVSLHADSSRVPKEERLRAVKVGGFSAQVNQQYDYAVLEEDEAAILMRRLTDNEVIDLHIEFVNAVTRDFSLYPGGNRTFYVSAEMFRTCIRTHMESNPTDISS